MGDAAFISDRGGVLPAPFAAAERIMLAQQAKYDRRAIPQLWYWRLILEDEVEGTVAHEVFDETTEPERRYAAPIAVHLYVNWSMGKGKKGGDAKAKKQGPNVETTGVTGLGFSRAEARRVGQLLQVRDDREGLVSNDKPRDFLFVPRPEDIFLARGRYYEVLQMKPEWWGSSSVITTWKGTATMLRDDITESGLPRLPKPPSFRPPLPSGALRGR